jgi:hypothetical protein
MGELFMHANEVCNCKACDARIVLLKNTNSKYIAFNVPDGEGSKSWHYVDDKDFHGCARKDRLALLKTRRP